MATPEQTEAPAPEAEAPAPEVAPAPEAAPEAALAPEPAPEAAPAPDAEAPTGGESADPPAEADPEPGSPRRKRPREPSLVVPRLDASFWEQLVVESRATREASRRERFENLMRF